MIYLGVQRDWTMMLVMVCSAHGNEENLYSYSNISQQIVYFPMFLSSLLYSITQEILSFYHRRYWLHFYLVLD